MSVKENQTIFHEGQDVNSVNVLLKGKAEAYISLFENSEEKSENNILKQSYRIFELGQNTFIGASDILLSGKYSLTCHTVEDSNVYGIVAKNQEQLKAILASNKDYGAFFTASLSALITQSYTAFNKIQEFAAQLGALCDNLSVFLWAHKAHKNFTYLPSGRCFSEGFENYQKILENEATVPDEFSSLFFEQDNSSVFETSYSYSSNLNTSKIKYYKSILNIPSDICKSYFTSDDYVTEYHIKDASECLYDILNSIKNAFRAADSYMSDLFTAGEDCILAEYSEAAAELARSGGNNSTLLRIIGYAMERIKKAIERYKSDYLYTPDIEPKQLDELYAWIESQGISKSQPVSAAWGDNSGEMLPEELRDSARKIVEYSEIPWKQAELFLEDLKLYGRHKSHLQDSESRNLVSSITSNFFLIYENVLKKAVEQKDNSRLINMFLTYAYMDERLLNPKHTLELYRLAGRNLTKAQSSVYDIKTWLTMVYEMEKEPSINEFGQDYYGVFREMKKRGELTDKDKAAYDNGKDNRLKHEINNLFRINQKVCHGQINSYFPILSDEMVARELSKAIVTPELVEQDIVKVLEIDFSAFHREVSFRNAEKDIEKEFIQKFAKPDIILMPTFGSRQVMWQELTGRDRSTSARFVLPLFTSENLFDLIIKLIGNFRWELCRTMMGASWNDVSESSLTSDYTDFIQFYKKNKELSEEAKEKITTQIQKYRNSTREIFTSDYETWIKYESKGILRLNKIARSVLFKHCTFSRKIRESLEKQPVFSDMINQFKNQRTKLVKSLESKYNRYAKLGPLDSELEENLIFYRDL
ncbi:MAG: cyclic nucleotide-binding domain-containing protein [Bacillota bacterium]|nr:cyclic nucleotide-binding domain-containing protein [Bacillota bacterium]